MSTGLPQGWTRLRICEVAEFNPKHSVTIDDATLVTFVPMAAASETGPVLDTSRPLPLREVRKGYTHFADGDVLFAKITPCMENGKGGVAQRLSNGLGCGTTEFVVMRPSPVLNSFFLYWFLAQPAFRREAKENFTGTAGQARVPTSFLEDAVLPLPPLAEQRRIVAKLEALLSKVDACRQRLAKIPTILKRFRQSVLAAACSGRLTADWREENKNTETGAKLLRRLELASGSTLFRCEKDAIPFEIPTTWELVQAQGLTQPNTIITYGILKPVWNDDGIPAVRIQDMQNGTLLIDQIGRCSRDRADKFSKTTLQTGDLLVAKDGATLGKTAVVPSELNGANITQHILRFSINRLVNAAFVRMVIDSPHGQAWMKGETKGVALPGVNVGDFRKMPIQLPPLAEQHEIVRRVDALFAFADTIEARFAKAQAQVDNLTASLLAKAFRGELVPQDPNDEPASALLERIRAEKAANSGSNPAKSGKAIQRRRAVATPASRPSNPTRWKQLRLTSAPPQSEMRHG